MLKERGIKHKTLKKKLPKMVILSNSLIEKAVQENIDHTRQTLGVCSFAGNPRNILMWSHYGQYHEGVCYQFERARDITVFGQAIPIRYSKKYPTINWVKSTPDDYEHLLFNKSEDWSYEQEERIIADDKANTFLNFDPSSLTGIILGCKIKDETVASIKELLQERASNSFSNIKLYKSIQHDSEYRIVIKRFDL